MSPIMRFCVAHGSYEPGNPPTPRGRCPLCYQRDNKRRHRKAMANGSRSPHWATVRQQRLQLDGGRCTFQLPRCTGRAETVHLAPDLRANHLLANLDNTRSACRHCHGVVDAPRSKTRGGGGRPS